LGARSSSPDFDQELFFFPSRLEKERVTKRCYLPVFILPQHCWQQTD
jgi:hypothetical protein